MAEIILPPSAQSKPNSNSAMEVLESGIFQPVSAGYQASDAPASQAVSSGFKAPTETTIKTTELLELKRALKQANDAVQKAWDIMARHGFYPGADDVEIEGSTNKAGFEGMNIYQANDDPKVDKKAGFEGMNIYQANDDPKVDKKAGFEGMNI